MRSRERVRDRIGRGRESHERERDKRKRGETGGGAAQDTCQINRQHGAPLKSDFANTLCLASGQKHSDETYSGN